MSRESCHACGEPIRVIQSAAYHLLKAKHCNDLFFFFFFHKGDYQEKDILKINKAKIEK